jgi:hypothetical protein
MSLCVLQVLNLEDLRSTSGLGDVPQLGGCGWMFFIPYVFYRSSFFSGCNFFLQAYLNSAILNLEDREVETAGCFFYL